MLVTYRAPSPEDEPKLLSIYADSRSDELALFGWDAAAVDAFVRMQYHARERAYKMQFPALEDNVICFDGEIAGRVMVDRPDCRVHLVDIAVGRHFRRRGIGSGVIESLKREAAGLGKAFTLRVVSSNVGAVDLYRRLGLREVRGEGQWIEFEWSGDDNPG